MNIYIKVKGLHFIRLNIIKFVKRLKHCLVSGSVADGEKERSYSLTKTVIRMEEEDSVNDSSDEKTSVLVKSIATTIRINLEKVKIDSQETKV